MKYKNKLMNYFSKNLCKNNYLYIINGKNAFLGIYKSRYKKFYISFFKKNKKKDINYHKLETAKPIKELFKVTPSILKTEKEFLRFMNAYYKEYEEEIHNIVLWAR